MKLHNKLAFLAVILGGLLPQAYCHEFDHEDEHGNPIPSDPSAMAEHAMGQPLTLYQYNHWGSHSNYGSDIELKNQAGDGAPPYANVGIGWYVLGGHGVHNSLFEVTGVIEGSTADGSTSSRGIAFSGNGFLAKITPADGDSGVVRVRLTHTSGAPSYTATASWSFEIDDPCKSCHGSCSSEASIGSVKLEIPVGVLGNGRISTRLKFYSEGLANPGPGSLELVGDNGDATIVESSWGMTSIECGDHIANIVPDASVDDPNRFRIDVSYDKTDAANTIFRSATVEILSNGDLQISETLNGKTTVKTFSEPTADEWVLEEAGLRKKTRTLEWETTANGGNWAARSYRFTTEEKNAAGSWVTVSDWQDSETSFGGDWRLTRRVVDPDGQALTYSYEYYEYDEYSGPNNDTSGRYRIKTETFPTGLVRSHQYLDTDPYNASYDKVHIIKEHFAGTTEAKETRIHQDDQTDMLSTLEEVWVSGTLVSKKETTGQYSSGQYWQRKKVYPSAAGPALETYTDFDPAGDLVRHTTLPDGTIYAVAEDYSGDLLTITKYRGVENPSAGQHYLLRGTESVTTTNEYGEVVYSANYQVDAGVAYLLEEKLATQQDLLTRPTKYEVTHGNASTPTYAEFLQYGCCGLEKVTGQDGIATYTYKDDLGRVRKTHRNGIAQETVFDGLTTRSHLYPEATASSSSYATSTNELSNRTVNLAGEEVSRQSRSAKDGELVTTTTATSYNLGSGIGRREVVTLPQTTDDQGVTPAITTDYYIDGRMKSRSGPTVIDSLWSYASETAGIETTSSYADTMGTAYQTKVSQADWASRTVSITYAGDADGDSQPDQQTFEYDGGGRVVKAVDPDGVTTLTTYNLSTGEVISAIDMNDNDTIDLGTDRVQIKRSGIGVNGSSEVVSWSEVAGRVDDGGGGSVEKIFSRTEAKVDGLKSWDFTYGDGTTATTTRVVTYASTQGGNWDLTTTYPDATYSVDTYVGALLGETEVFSSTSASLYTLDYTYDSYQRLTDVEDSRQADTSYDYVDNLVSAISEVSRGSRVTSFTYDDRGRRLTVDEPNSLDESNNTVTNIRTTSYWPHNGVRQESGTPGYQMSFTYDDAHRLSTMTTYGTATAVTRWLYDSDRGWLTGKRYNSPSPGQGDGEDYTYTAAGRRDVTTLARGTTRDRDYDAGGALSGIDYSDGTTDVVISSRDQLGRVVVLSDGAGQRTMSYDGWSGLAEEAYGGGGVLDGWSVYQTRDSVARPTALAVGQTGTGINQHSSNYYYNNSGQLWQVESGNHSGYYGYNGTSQRVEQVSVADGSGSILYGTRQYDSLLRLDRISYHNGQTSSGFELFSDFDYGRDGYGRITSALLRDGTQWGYKYNSAGEIASAKRKLTAAGSELVAGQSFEWEFDGIGNRTTMSSWGDSNAANLRDTDYTPNALNQYTSIANPDEVNIVGRASSSATVTVNGNTATRQGDFFRFEGTASNGSGPDYFSATITDWTDTTTGNLLFAPASQTPSYDDDGNLTNDDVHEYTWDAENRLIKVETLSSAVSAGVPYRRVEYVYDSNSRRVQREVYDGISAPTPIESTRYLWAGWRCLAELDSEDGVETKLVWGLDQADQFHLGDGNGALLWTYGTTSSDSRFYCYDGNGNVVALCDESGDQTAEYLYNPFGELLEKSGPQADENLYRFSTKEHDLETGLLCYGFRHLRPDLGRWINRDPITETGGANLYGFANNDGINRMDVLGLITCEELKRALLLAKLAQAAYENYPPPGGWKQIEAFEDDASGLAVSVFESGAGEAVIAFRGTENDWPLLDWTHGNTQGIVGLGAPQYALVAGALGRKIAAAYPDAEVVGHSLGGGLASMFGTMYERTTNTFNSAGLHESTMSAVGVTSSGAAKYVTAHYVSGEILSGGQDHFFNRTLLGKDLTPGAVGVRVPYAPELYSNFSPPDGWWSAFSPGYNRRKALELAGLPVSLHSMDEVIQAIVARIEKCCKNK